MKKVKRYPEKRVIEQEEKTHHLLTYRITVENLDALRKAARKADRPMTYLLNQIVEEYFKK